MCAPRTSSDRATYPTRSTFRWRSWNSGWPNYRRIGRLSPIVAARGASCRSRPSRRCVSVVIASAGSKTASRNGRWPGFLSPCPEASPERAGVTLFGIRLSSGRLHYAWVIVAVTFAVAIMTAGVRSTPGVLIVPLEEEFHWSRATISFALGINLLLFGAIGPFAAAVMDRFGARRTMTVALATTAVSVALTPAMSEPWQLILLWGVVVGLSTGFIGGYVAAYIAGRWFRSREGLVVGLLTAAAAAGQLVFLPTMAFLVTHWGWRMMSLVLAGTVIVFLPVPALLMRDRPEDVGLRPYGDNSAIRLHAAPEGNPVTVAFRALATGAQS